MPSTPNTVALHTGLIWLLVSMLLTSCSSDLSRSKAESILEKEIPYPNVRVATIYIGNYTGSNLNDDSTSHTYEFVENANLRNDGYINFQSSPYGINESWRVRLTDKAQQYVVEGNTTVSCDENSHCHPIPIKVRLAEVNIDDITGITGGKHPFKNQEYREVEYTEIYENVTPFGEAVGLSNGFTRKAKKIFVLFDDGWRLAE